MLALKLRPGEACVQTAAPPSTEGVVALIGLVGSGGTGASCSAAFACRMASQLPMIEARVVDGEVL